MSRILWWIAAALMQDRSAHAMPDAIFTAHMPYTDAACTVEGEGFGRSEGSGYLGVCLGGKMLTCNPDGSIHEQFHLNADCSGGDTGGYSWSDGGCTELAPGMYMKVVLDDSTKHPCALDLQHPDLFTTVEEYYNDTACTVPNPGFARRVASSQLGVCLGNKMYTCMPDGSIYEQFFANADCSGNKTFGYSWSDGGCTTFFGMNFKVDFLHFTKHPCNPGPETTTCRDVKRAYKAGECCGNPDNVVTMPAERRLSGTSRRLPQVAGSKAKP